MLSKILKTLINHRKLWICCLLFGKFIQFPLLKQDILHYKISRKYIYIYIYSTTKTQENTYIYSTTKTQENTYIYVYTPLQKL